MSIIFNYTSIGPLKHIQLFISDATWPSSARIHSSQGVVVSALRGPSEVLPQLRGWYLREKNAKHYFKPIYQRNEYNKKNIG